MPFVISNVVSTAVASMEAIIYEKGIKLTQASWSPWSKKRKDLEDTFRSDPGRAGFFAGKVMSFI